MLLVHGLNHEALPDSRRLHFMQVLKALEIILLVLHLDVSLSSLPRLEGPISILTGVVITLIDYSEGRWDSLRNRMIR
jgi:hypothetical protein